MDITRACGCTIKNIDDRNIPSAMYQRWMLAQSTCADCQPTETITRLCGCVETVKRDRDRDVDYLSRTLCEVCALEKICYITEVRSNERRTLYNVYPATKKYVSIVYLHHHKEALVVDQELLTGPLEDNEHDIAHSAGYLPVDKERFQQIREVYSARINTANENKRLSYVLFALEQEAELAESFRATYLPERMNEILASRKPTFVEALKRGIAWTESIPGIEGHSFWEEDGALSADFFGTLYVGCYGAGKAREIFRDHQSKITRINLAARDGEEARFRIHLIQEVEKGIQHLMTRGGRLRSIGEVERFYVSGAARGSSTKYAHHSWYEPVKKKYPFFAPRTEFLRFCEELDEKIEQIVQSDNQKFADYQNHQR